jgi:hypothetical protein
MLGAGMDQAFWIGLVLTTALALPVGILGSIIHHRNKDWIDRILDDRRFTSLEKRRAKAEDDYKLFLKYLSEEKSITLKMLYLALLAITSTVLGAIFIALPIFLAAVQKPQPGTLNSYTLLFGYLYGSLMLWLAAYIVMKFGRERRKFDNPEGYFVRLRARGLLGPDVSPPAKKVRRSAA